MSLTRPAPLRLTTVNNNSVRALELTLEAEFAVFAWEHFAVHCPNRFLLISQVCFVFLL